MAIINIEKLNYSYGKKEVLKDIHIQIDKPRIIGLVAPNGTGKSTFLRILSGQLEPTTGDVIITPGQRLSFLQQDHFKYDEYTVLDTKSVLSP